MMKPAALHKSPNQEIMHGCKNRLHACTIIDLFLAPARTIFLVLVTCFLFTVEASAQVTIYTTNSAVATGGNTVTVTHDLTGAGANRLMLVGISSRDRVVNTVTYDGDPLDFVGSEASNTDAVTYIYRLVDPPQVNGDVVVTFTGNLGGNNAGIVGVMTFTGVDQNNPNGPYASIPGIDASPSLTIPSTTTNQLIYQVLTVTDVATISLNSGQTQRWQLQGSSRPIGGGYTRAGLAGSTTLSYTLSQSRRWSLSGLAINPVPFADRAVTKSVNNSFPFIGQSVTFTVIASNNGPDSAPNVEVNDLLPSGYTYVTHSATTGAYNGETGIWNVGSLSNGASSTLTITAIVNASGLYTNTATITGSAVDTNGANNSASVSITICQAGGTKPLFSN